MSDKKPVHAFHPQLPDAAGVVSWIHVGDLHMTRAGEQNHLDLRAIVEEVNAVFADSISFVFLPGDVADDGSRVAYAVVRAELDRLQVPWCAIVGDHDVHERTHANFLESMARQLNYSFTVGEARFIAMNAFDIADPASFSVSEQQLQWVESELEAAAGAGQAVVLLLHCYPSDLKTGGRELADLIRRYEIQLVDMGHTHYNEIANDGRTLYTATRSTGQIEEGPVGFSVTNLDHGTVSWRFLELGRLPAVVITSPSDERLLIGLQGSSPMRELRVRAKVWAGADIAGVFAEFEGREFAMRRVSDSQIWEATVESSGCKDGVHAIRVVVEDVMGQTAEDMIRVLLGDRAGEPERLRRDQDNALQSWPEHGLLGTQLGPNKNGKKW